MRTKVIAAAIASGALAFLLAACGGGTTQGSSAAPSGNHTAARQTATAIPTTLPHTGGMPDQPVCEAISKEVVEQAIGKKVYSANAAYLSTTEQPTECYYYTDTDQIDNVKIQWQTPEDALWSDYYNNPGATVGGDTVRTQVSGLGGDAYKEVGEIDGVKAIGYSVLLKSRGIVLSVYDTSGLSDAAVRNATKEAIKVIDKL